MIDNWKKGWTDESHHLWSSCPLVFNEKANGPAALKCLSYQNFKICSSFLLFEEDNGLFEIKNNGEKVKEKVFLLKTQPWNWVKNIRKTL